MPTTLTRKNCLQILQAMHEHLLARDDDHLERRCEKRNRRTHGQISPPPSTIHQASGCSMPESDE